MSQIATLPHELILQIFDILLDNPLFHTTSTPGNYHDHIRNSIWSPISEDPVSKEVHIQRVKLTLVCRSWNALADTFKLRMFRPKVFPRVMTPTPQQTQQCHRMEISVLSFVHLPSLLNNDWPQLRILTCDLPASSKDDLTPLLVEHRQHLESLQALAIWRQSNGDKVFDFQFKALSEAFPNLISLTIAAAVNPIPQASIEIRRLEILVLWVNESNWEYSKLVLPKLRHLTISIPSHVVLDLNEFKHWANNLSSLELSAGRKSIKPFKVHGLFPSLDDLIVDPDIRFSLRKSLPSPPLTVVVPIYCPFDSNSRLYKEEYKDFNIKVSMVDFEGMWECRFQSHQHMTSSELMDLIDQRKIDIIDMDGMRIRDWKKSLETDIHSSGVNPTKYARSYQLRGY